MSHGARSVVATLFGVATLLTVGIAQADCSTTHSASAAPPPTSDTVGSVGTPAPSGTQG